MNARMMVSGRLLVVVLALACAIRGAATQLQGATANDVPSRFTDQEFWRLTDILSEQSGVFPDENLLSNELTFAQIVPDLVARTKPGGVYLGVGPEQNFTYIAALKPRIAFITDIRRGNLQLQLLYKALFELAADRADFVSRLFTKKRPLALTSTSPVSVLMDAFWSSPSSEDAAFGANLKEITDLLTKTHRFPLSPEDLDGVARVYRAFYWYGPAMNPVSDTSLKMDGVGRGGPTYRDLMTQADANGHALSYLGSEEQFAVVKDLQHRNLIVPIVGDFSGTHALRAIGRYLKEHQATVSAFYLSNVESYLRRAGSWPAFCANVATMPLDEASVFVRVYLTSVTIYPKGIPMNGPSKAAIVPIAGDIKGCNASRSSDGMR